ncbi:MAG: hypothetical protein KGS61_02780 [Verrucomicrobia bacterium]|nr:hypothetical protein [Verrucomicrobiota bacterium]
MKTLVWKEVRLILPAWIAAGILAIGGTSVVALTARVSPLIGSLIPTPFRLGILLLALVPFGQEFGCDTFSLLLAQPVSRRSIWRTKVGLLAVATVTVTALFFLSFIVLDGFRPGSARGLRFGYPWQVLLMILATATGGLWTTLLFRQTIAAFAFTLLIPVAVSISIIELFTSRGPFGAVTAPIATAVVDGALLVYAIAGFLWARYLFFHAQDTQWTGGTLTLPAWLGPPSAARGARSRRCGSLPALIRKELQLQHVTFLLGGLLALLHLLLIAGLKVHPTLAEPVLANLLSSLWLLWLVMPIVVGSIAVAEERKLGTLETFLCQPVARRTQMSVKFAVALMAGILLGTFVPGALEGLTGLVTSAVDVRREVFGTSSAGMGLVLRAMFSGALTVIAIYASSLARTTLHALGLALVLALMSGGVMAPINFSTEPGFFLNRPAWFWAYVIGLPILPATLLGLSYANCKRLLEPSKVWRRNLGVLAVALLCVIVASNAIYQRAWEWVLPLEPRHGPARLPREQPVTLELNRRDLVVHLPDRRVWLNPTGWKIHTSALVRFASRDYSDGTWQEWPFSLGRGHFVPESNWIDVATAWRQVLGIRNDGSLWSLATSLTNRLGTEVFRIGSDSDWRQVVFGGGGFLLLKNDGSLWWKLAYAGYATNLPTVLVARPVRVGSDSDWERLFEKIQAPFARKRNGQTWEAQYRGTTGSEQLVLRRRLDLAGADWASLSEGKLGFAGPAGKPRWVEFVAGVQADGSLWVWFNEEQDGGLSPIATRTQKLQLGKGRRWKSAWISYHVMIALETDGALWKWEVAWTAGPEEWLSSLVKSVPVRVGRNSDWLAISHALWPPVALAADGTLWRPVQFEGNRLFVPSRIPQRVASIFDDVN